MLAAARIAAYNGKRIGKRSMRRRKRQLSFIDAEIDALAELFFACRGNVQTFAQAAVREIIIDRLEGARRSHSGHMQEIVFRTALSTSLQTFVTANGGYGKYDSAEMLTKQLKVGSATVDIAIRLKQLSRQSIGRSK